jgi:hypothetical protein
MGLPLRVFVIAVMPPMVVFLEYCGLRGCGKNHVSDGSIFQQSMVNHPILARLSDIDCRMRAKPSED